VGVWWDGGDGLVRVGWGTLVRCSCVVPARMDAGLFGCYPIPGINERRIERPVLDPAKVRLSEASSDLFLAGSRGGGFLARIYYSLPEGMSLFWFDFVGIVCQL